MNIKTRKKRNESIRDLYQRGYTYQMIAERMDIAITTVWRVLKSEGVINNQNQ